MGVHFLKRQVLLLDENKLSRISELARLSKERDLTPSEKQEQKELRDEYRQGFVRNLKAQLENTKIINPDGTVINVADKKKGK